MPFENLRCHLVIYNDVLLKGKVAVIDWFCFRNHKRRGDEHRFCPQASF
jgi:hypothetical protein